MTLGHTSSFHGYPYSVTYLPYSIAYFRQRHSYLSSVRRRRLPTTGYHLPPLFRREAQSNRHAAEWRGIAIRHFVGLGCRERDKTKKYKKWLENDGLWADVLEWLGGGSARHERGRDYPLNYQTFLGNLGCVSSSWWQRNH
jgi:hypothetical protein